MKFLLAVVCYVSVVALVSAQRGPPQGPPGRGRGQPQSEEAKKAEEMLQRCETQEQVTESDMRDFLQQRRPSTTTGKCLHACLMETVGLVQDGKLSVENSVRFLSQMARGNADLTKIIEEIANECANVADEDRCELAFKIMTCTEEGIHKRQDQLRKFMQRPQQPPQ